MNPANVLQPPAIPDHELLSRVGRGSYGEVWLARSVMGTFRAVKVIRRETFESDRPYEREFSGIQKFEPVSRSHPGLVSVLHIGRNRDAGYFYYVMEVADDLASGPAIDPARYTPRTLARVIAQRGRLAAEEGLPIALTLTGALSHLHLRGLIHRDIKPANIIFVEGAPKLADIGLVTDIGEKATCVGTEGYLPPEGPGSPPADLYSLGKVLYEMSTGKTPDQFPELPTRLREFPDAASLLKLNDVVLKACAPQVERRFRSAEEMRAALAALHDGHNPEPGIQRPDSALGGTASGPRVVILCPSEAPEDLALAQRLGERCAAEGFGVFVDDHSGLSVDWARQIERQIQSAHSVVALMSRTSIRSAMLAYALEIMRQAARQQAGRPKLLPIRIQLTSALPRTLSLAVGETMGLDWRDPQDDDRVAGLVIEALRSLCETGRTS